MVPEFTAYLIVAWMSRPRYYTVYTARTDEFFYLSNPFTPNRVQSSFTDCRIADESTQLSFHKLAPVNEMGIPGPVQVFLCSKICPDPCTLDFSLLHSRAICVVTSRSGLLSRECNIGVVKRRKGSEQTQGEVRINKKEWTKDE